MSQKSEMKEALLRGGISSRMIYLAARGVLVCHSLGEKAGQDSDGYQDRGGER